MVLLKITSTPRAARLSYKYILSNSNLIDNIEIKAFCSCRYRYILEPIRVFSCFLSYTQYSLLLLQVLRDHVLNRYILEPIRVFF